MTNVPLYRYLPEELKKQLHGHINIFLSEKRFEGCGGIEITDQIRVTIAALACILLLNRKTDYYPRLKSILVYPHPYVAENVASIGSTRVHEWSFRAGESWTTGAVVIAWDEVEKRARDLDDGHNVVLHEFAHQLDVEDGTGTAGTPILGQKSSYVTWARVLGRGYRNLREKVSRNEQDIMDEYGATNEAEFFAVVTETFFEKPLQLQKIHPALYDQLRDYYQLDPAEWSEGTEKRKYH
jgi:Mlc titration factor MtfA (ptsG expression regulator)